MRRHQVTQAELQLTRQITRQPGALAGQAPPPDPVEARTQAACQAFEGFLLGEMMKIMQETVVSQQGLLPTSRAEQMFRRQQAEALGEILAAREPLGIARLLRQSLPREGRCK